MAEHNALGIKGEETALRFLKEKGYVIRETNWKFGKEEIDIIAEKDGIITIVEVKTRSGITFGDPEEFVSRQKQRHLVRAANGYVEGKNINLEVRFDIISIVTSGSTYRVNHIEDAFYPLL